MSRARFVNEKTGEDVFVYDTDIYSYRCTVCPKSRRNDFYNVPEMVGHIIDIHYQSTWDEVKEKYIDKVVPGHEIFENVIGV